MVRSFRLGSVAGGLIGWCGVLQVKWAASPAPVCHKHRALVRLGMQLALNSVDLQECPDRHKPSPVRPATKGTAQSTRSTPQTDPLYLKEWWGHGRIILPAVCHLSATAPRPAPGTTPKVPRGPRGKSFPPPSFIITNRNGNSYAYT
jgi:hypothetical protein